MRIAQPSRSQLRDRCPIGARSAHLRDPSALCVAASAQHFSGVVHTHG